MSLPAHREIRQTSFVGKLFRLVFWAFNALMLYLLIRYWSQVGQHFRSLAEHGQAGATIGTAIGSMMVLIVWLLGAGILGALVLATRGPRILVPIETTEAPIATPIATAPTNKKGREIFFHDLRVGSVIIACLLLVVMMMGRP